jgi:predicted AlkP superfamily pyrophosphatase or phosphodiesterase
MKVCSSVVAVLFLLVFASLEPSPAAAAKPDMLILISIDGFRADYLSRGRTPNLSRLAAQGVTASMRPSFPSITFPNHYTLVTGLRPDHHGIVDNTMRDPVLGNFTMAKSQDPRWWDEAEPLWVTADKQGLRTATMFWPGSDDVIRGRRPDEYRLYDHGVRADQRTDQVLAWLDAPPEQRPSFVTLYFDMVDGVGHVAGPDSPDVDVALHATDAAIGRLVEGLSSRGLLDRTNIIIVADHGMAAVSPDRLIYLDDVAGAAAIDVVSWGANAGVIVKPDAPAGAEHKLLAIDTHARCWRKTDIPRELHYGSNPRIPPIVCSADVGWLLITHEIMTQRGGALHEKGAHGYQPDVPEMAAIFIAHGPAFRPGTTLPTFDNVDVQPLMAKLLGLTVPNGDGTAATFHAALAR